MRPRIAIVLAAALVAGCTGLADPGSGRDHGQRLFMDVHRLAPGEVSEDGVARAHAADLAVQADHGVRYERYWVSEDAGTIYCLVAAPSAGAAAHVHREAHGLVADEIREVRPGILPARPAGGRRLFMDTHDLGHCVASGEVADAHRKDLAVQGRHGVRFLEYWVDEAGGRIHCLVEADSAQAVVDAHREAHGLLPTAVDPVVEGR